VVIAKVMAGQWRSSVVEKLLIVGLNHDHQATRPFGVAPPLLS